MSGAKTWCVVVLALVALASPATGQQVDAVLQVGDSFLGEIATTGDTDVVVLGAVAGSYLRLVVKPTGNSAMKPAVELIDQTTGRLLVREMATGPRAVVVHSQRLPSSGLYRVRVRGAQASTGSYCIQTRGRMTRPALTVVANETVPAGEQLTLRFEAGPGFSMSAVVVADPGSPADMVNPVLRAPSTVVDVELAERSRHLLLDCDTLPQYGTYELTLDNRGGTGAVVGRLILRQPHHRPEVHTEPTDS